MDVYKDDLIELWRALYAQDAALVDLVCRTGRIPHEVMDKGGDPNVFTHWTPLTYAILWQCSLPILDQLIQNGARVETPEPGSKELTPLARAAKANRLYVVHHLLNNHGVNINATMGQL